MAKWRLDFSEPRNDGTGQIALDIWGVEDDGSTPIPGKHTTVLVDGGGVQDALDLSTNAATNAAIKALIAAELPDAEWSDEALDAIILANAEAVVVDSNLDGYVDTELSGYPVAFSL